MTTSRTGTASHKHFRKRVLARDRNAGVTQCPLCGTPLDYDHGRRPNSAEPDHIIPYTHGGTNDPANGRTICRQCNQARGNRMYTATPDQPTPTITTLINW